MSQKREVRLYGELGRRFGRIHHLAVETAAEAIRALAANFADFERALMDHPHGFHVLAGREDRAEKKALHLPTSEREPIKIVPAVAGAKSAFFKILLGAALLAAALFNPLAFFGGSALLTGAAATIATGIGASLIISGVSQLLTPTPKYGTGSDEEQKQSYVFSGPVNTSAQGQAVPLGYGRMIIGSAVISMGLTVQELPT